MFSEAADKREKALRGLIRRDEEPPGLADPEDVGGAALLTLAGQVFDHHEDVVIRAVAREVMP